MSNQPSSTELSSKNYLRHFIPYGDISRNFGSKITESAVRRCSSKYMFLKICNIHRKTPMLES